MLCEILFPYRQQQAVTHLQTMAMLRIKQIARERKMPISTLAREVGYSQTYLYNVANNKENVTLRILNSIAEVLGVPVWALFEDAPPYNGIGAEPVQQPLPELVD